MLGVLGLGQAGSNFAEEASKYGIVSGVINYSQKDLDSVDVKHKLRLLGSEGVGKNRDEAIALFQDQWEIALKFIQDHFSNCDVIAFAFSSSGGSGSGISPILLDIATNSMPDKTFIAFVVMPELSEATSSQINCLKTFEELSGLNIAIFPVDNQLVRNQNPYVGKNKLYELSNRNSIALLYKLAMYTDMHSKNGNFDKKDFITVLRTQGIATIAEVDIAVVGQNISLTPEGVADKVRKSWANTLFTPVEMEKVTRAAIIFDGQESLMEQIRHDLMFSEFIHGMPVDLFEGNYHESNGKIVSILTGLAWCNSRLQDIERLNKSNQERVESMMANQMSYQSNASDLLSKIRKPVEKEQKKSMLDILSKYKR
ncbi:hypothetical protein [Paenibacillus cremeus]|uniref:Tubulin/FtsZ GTPase domain-containing protein n=1 Tax=Paenibacillus cremeus TaxID=2163881 RepID=A0A559KCU9_9BACL|nr:hypothetical protein [Paenibacillus cremeus]TVY09944.1 hypothetical protein FPZ49_11270 [Paenibacillus cremeus]